jgi:hypothetical protein
MDILVNWVHFMLITLNICFPNKWMGTKGLMSMPPFSSPRSPDLSPSDSVLGYVKDKEYSKVTSL